jgi:hypothetical protein
VSTPFAKILQDAVERTPRAIGGAFAAPDGEMVDFFAAGDPLELAILTAHYGVVLSNLEAAFNTWHFGGPQFFVCEHTRVDVLVHIVEDGYYALLAVEQPSPLGVALGSLTDAVVELRREMRG